MIGIKLWLMKNERHFLAHQKRNNNNNKCFGFIFKILVNVSYKVKSNKLLFFQSVYSSVSDRIHYCLIPIHLLF